MNQASAPLEWHFATWVWPGSDDQGWLHRFLSDKLEALGRRGFSSRSHSPFFEVGSLSLIDDTPWAGTGVVVRPREDLPDYQKYEFGTQEIRRIFRLAEEMEGLPVGAVGLVAAWVGSDEARNVLVNGDITFEPVLKLLREDRGALQVYSFDDAFLEALGKVIPARQVYRNVGETVVPLAEEIRSVVEQVARSRFEKVPSWAALARQAALDMSLPKPSRPGGFKGRF